MGPGHKATGSDSCHLSSGNKILSHHSLELMNSPGMRLHDLGHGKQAKVLQVLVRILNKQAELGHTQLQRGETEVCGILCQDTNTSGIVPKHYITIPALC